MRRVTKSDGCVATFNTNALKERPLYPSSIRPNPIVTGEYGIVDTTSIWRFRPDLSSLSVTGDGDQHLVRVVGSQSDGYSDGDFSQARFEGMCGHVVSRDGLVLYVGACSNNAVRRVLFATKTVSTVCKLEGAYNVCFDRSSSAAAAVAGIGTGTGNDTGTATSADADTNIMQTDDETVLFVSGSTSTGEYALRRVNTKTGTSIACCAWEDGSYRFSAASQFSFIPCVVCMR